MVTTMKPGLLFLATALVGGALMLGAVGCVGEDPGADEASDATTDNSADGSRVAKAAESIETGDVAAGAGTNLHAVAVKQLSVGVRSTTQPAIEITPSLSAPISPDSTSGSDDTSAGSAGAPTGDTQGIAAPQDSRGGDREDPEPCPWSQKNSVHG